MLGKTSRTLLVLVCVLATAAATEHAKSATSEYASSAAHENATYATPRHATSAITEHATSAITEHSSVFVGCPEQCFCISHEEISCNINGTMVSIQYESAEYAYLTCELLKHGRDFWRHLPRLGNILRDVTALGVRDCPLPNGSYADVAVALGAVPHVITALTLRGAPDAVGLAREHLARLPALRKLSLADSPGFAVRTDLLVDCPALAELRAQDVRPELPLAGAAALRTLELAGADLRQVRRDSFRGQPGLRRLLLWSANVSALEEGAFGGLARLETLDLSSNALRELPSGLFQDTPRLRELSLASNELRLLPSGLLSGLAALEELRLHDNGAKLVLAPGSFAGLERLAVLQLSRSGIVTLPEDSLRGCGALRELWLAGNALETLPALAGLSALERLDASDNRLSRISSGQFSSLVALRTLVLDGNHIAEFPDGALDGLRSLDELNASQAGLARVQPRALAGASGLRVVRMSHNSLSLGTDAVSPFARLLRLERLDLAHNAVAGIPDDLRDVLLQLTWLNLAHNTIGDLQYADVNFLAENLTVDLRHNNISRLDLSVPRAARTDTHRDPPTLLLDGNPLLCDCALYSVRRVPRAVLGAALCSGPDALVGRRADEVPLSELACAVRAEECAARCDCTWWPASVTLRLHCGAWPTLPRAPPGARLALSLASAGLRSLTLPSVPPPELKEIDLGDNPLSELDESTARALLAHNRSVDFSRALLPCACAHAGLLDALAAAAPRLRAYDRMRCAGGGLLREAARRNCLSPGLLAGTIILTVALVVAAAAAWALRRGSGARAWLAVRGLRCLVPAEEAGEGGEKEYDVFVSFAHEDEALVAGALAPQLEAGGMRLCLHFRDWAVGEPIPEQIARSVRSSRRTLVVASAAWARSAWARLEWTTARAGGRAVVVLVGEWTPDTELARYLRAHTYVKWGDPWFWDKLLAALPPPRARAPTAPPRAPLPARLGFSDRLWGARGGGRLAHNVTLATAGTGCKDLSRK